MQLNLPGNMRPRTMWIIAGAVILLSVVIIAVLSGALGPSAETLAKSKDPADRKAAIEILGKRGSESSARLLASLASDRDRETARLAVRSLNAAVGRADRRFLSAPGRERSQSSF